MRPEGLPVCRVETLRGCVVAGGGAVRCVSKMKTSEKTAERNIEKERGRDRKRWCLGVCGRGVCVCVCVCEECVRVRVRVSDCTGNAN